MLNNTNNQIADLSLYASIVFASLTAFSLGFLASSTVSADVDIIDDVSIMVPIACTLSGTGNDSHNASIVNGTYQSDIGTTTLKAFCNDPNGFAIYAAGYTNNTIGAADSNKLVGTTAGIGNIVTGLATTAGNPDVSNWAMKLTATGDSGDTSGTNALTIDSAPNESGGANASFSNYHVVPNEYTKVAHKDAATNMDETTGGATLTTTYAAYISKTQSAGSYQGQVIYTLVHPATNIPNQERTCPANKVCYWPNAGDMTVNGVGVVDTMGNQTLASETTLRASNFKRADYGFVGWSDKYDWELNANDASGNGTGANAGYHIYGPNQTLTLNTSDYSGTNGGLSLYAVWAQSAGSLQSWTGCSSLGSGKVTALTDLRDNDTYAVAKLADGNCWMIENLRLDYDANITTANTQSNNGAFGGVFSGLAEPETANFTNSTTANSLYKSDGSGDIKGVNGATLTDIGTTNYPGSRFPRYRNDNTNTDSTINANVNVANMTGTDQNIYGYGNYYTWAAAMANTNYYNTTTVDANGFTPSEAAGTSLCPTGWKLPYGRSSGKGASTGGFSYLDIQLGGTGAISSPSTTPTGADMSKIYRSYPNNFLYSGRAYISSVNNRGSSGYYWSSTAYNYDSSYYLYLYSSSVNPVTLNLSKYDGFSIRCLVFSR